MLRVAKPTSPMSMGTWILTAFGGAAGARGGRRGGAGCCRGVLGLARRRCRRPGLAAGRPRRLAPALATYTAVLLADTAMPTLARGVPGAAVRLRRQRPGQRRRGRADRRAGRRQAGPAAAAGGRPAPRWSCAGAHRVETRLGPAQRAVPRPAGRAGCCAPARALTAVGVAGALLGRPQPGGVGAVRRGAAGRRRWPPGSASSRAAWPRPRTRSTRSSRSGSALRLGAARQGATGSAGRAEPT